MAGVGAPVAAVRARIELAGFRNRAVTGREVAEVVAVLRRRQEGTAGRVDLVVAVRLRVPVRKIHHDDTPSDFPETTIRRVETGVTILPRK